MQALKLQVDLLYGRMIIIIVFRSEKIWVIFVGNFLNHAFDVTVFPFQDCDDRCLKIDEK